MDSTFEIIKNVNELYNHSFDHLIAYTVGLIALVGFILPLAIQYIQTKSLRIEYENIIKKLKEDLKVLENTLRAEINTTIKNEIQTQMTNETVLIKERLNQNLVKHRVKYIFCRAIIFNP